ncbi:DUF1294 domain-containing protein [Aurantimonas sp. Leaf443]|uniref:DUF1294 domain-containing protein n=1 Tax=Aurantimonas sp. Leaf443 TaxID=1736378 RepID=UPI0006F27FE0|nr:DUF1294 domain-containing protein [Aurantimonas sp. Leaf443]KQT84083.1 hypothetical protein ASG48_11985 [Aurantimonas sp. Leaf443]
MNARLALAIVLYAAAINLLAYAAMAIDKARAGRRAPRIRERTLLALALLGGGAGTVIAQRGLRHKTRKEPFRTRLGAILLLHLVALVGLFAVLLSG